MRGAARVVDDDGPRLRCREQRELCWPRAERAVQPKNDGEPLPPRSFFFSLVVVPVPRLALLACAKRHLHPYVRADGARRPILTRTRTSPPTPQRPPSLPDDRTQAARRRHVGGRRAVACESRATVRRRGRRGIHARGGQRRAGRAACVHALRPLQVHVHARLVSLVRRGRTGDRVLGLGQPRGGLAVLPFFFFISRSRAAAGCVARDGRRMLVATVGEPVFVTRAASLVSLWTEVRAAEAPTKRGTGRRLHQHQHQRRAAAAGKKKAAV